MGKTRKDLEKAFLLVPARGWRADSTQNISPPSPRGYTCPSPPSHSWAMMPRFAYHLHETKAKDERCSGHTPTQRHVARSALNLDPAHLERSIRHHPHFTDEETEARRSNDLPNVTHQQSMNERGHESCPCSFSYIYTHAQSLSPAWIFCNQLQSSRLLCPWDFQARI